MSLALNNVHYLWGPDEAETPQSEAIAFLVGPHNCTGKQLASLADQIARFRRRVIRWHEFQTPYPLLLSELGAQQLPTPRLVFVDNFTKDGSITPTNFARMLALPAWTAAEPLVVRVDFQPNHQAELQPRRYWIHSAQPPFEVEGPFVFDEQGKQNLLQRIGTAL